ncbi:MAG: DNA polymerase IV [Verrucomicrobia bacterium]|nr:DNA polymerase IV [Verrucomicrobiota bacterium]
MFRVILHLDMDAFYASVEQRDTPALRGLPVVVGAPPTQRGVVAAASYEARKFGVRSAMPSVTARRLCPSAVFVRPRMDVYREESRLIMGWVASLAGNLIQQVSVDEAYVDVTGRTSGSTHDDALRSAIPIAQALKAAIQEARSLTASVGIGPNKLLAKLGSDFKKPDGLTLILDSEKAGFLRPLPVRSLHGVGQVTESQLTAAGIRTVGDLQTFTGDLRPFVGSWAAELRRFAMGEDSRPLDLGDEVKSISSENTFLQDTEDRPTLRACLREQAAEIAGKLARQRLAARTVQVKVRYGDFTTLSRQISLEEPIVQASDLYRLGCWLLGREKLVSRPLRLIGLGVSGLVETRARQLWFELGGPFSRKLS